MKQGMVATMVVSFSLLCAGQEPALAAPVNKALLDVQAAKLLQQELDAQFVRNGAETAISAAWAWEAPEQGDLPTSTWD